MSDTEPDLASFSGVRPGDRVLDLAAGRGRASVALLAAGARVVLLDHSVRGLRNPLEGTEDAPRVQGDGGELPFRTAVFDGVVVRAAVHHLVAPVTVLREAARVLRPGGTLVVVDKAASDELPARARRNAIERLRHSGHVWAHSEVELGGLGEAARLVPERCTAWDEEKDADVWLDGGNTEPRVRSWAREALAADADRGGLALGTRRDGDRLVLHERWAALRFRKPEGRA